MIAISCDFQSRILNTKTYIKVYIPNQINMMKEIKDFNEYYRFDRFKTLYLLHGAWDDAKTWIDNTSVVRYAQNHNLALVLPSVGNSFYSDMVHGEQYFKFFTEELLGFVKNMFPVAQTREDSYIGGNSMGGYGAFKIALNCPDLFSKAFSLSGTVEIQSASRYVKILGVSPENVFEDIKNLKGTKDDLMMLLEQSKVNGQEIPALYQAVGLKDYMYSGNQEFRKRANQLGIPLCYEEGPGDHRWDFWDEYVERAIDWCIS